MTLKSEPIKLSPPWLTVVALNKFVSGQDLVSATRELNVQERASFERLLRHAMAIELANEAK